MNTTKANLTHWHALLFDLVRRLRAEACNLLETTDESIAILNDTSLAEDDAQLRIQHALTIGNQIISEHGSQVQKYFDAINTLLAQHPELNVHSGEDVSSDITFIHVAWDKALWNWPDSTKGDLPGNILFLVRFTDTASQNVARWGSQNLPKSTRQQVADVLVQTSKS